MLDNMNAINDSVLVQRIVSNLIILFSVRNHKIPFRHIIFSAVQPHMVQILCFTLYSERIIYRVLKFHEIYFFEIFHFNKK